MKLFSIACVSSLAISTAAQANLMLPVTRGQDYHQMHDDESLGCLICSVSVNVSNYVSSSQFVHQSAQNLFSGLCLIVMPIIPFTHGWTSCYPLIKRMLDTLVIAWTGSIFTKDRVCNEELHFCTYPHIRKITAKEAVSKILADKPDKIKNDDYHQQLYAEIDKDKRKRKGIKTVHFSDIHLDLDYKVGSLVNCGAILCCREEWGFPEKAGDIAAGEWGSFGDCDIPAQTYQSMLDYIVNTVKPDLIFWTGDNSAHDLWRNTAEEAAGYTSTTTRMLFEALEGADITVIPVLGNHDTWITPHQSFAKARNSYEIRRAGTEWKNWLTPDAMELFKDFGYYSMPLKLHNGKKVPHGSQVIALNTNACADGNMFNYGQREDPGGHLSWLERTLREVEAAGGIAIIAEHMPNQQCQFQFGIRYKALMERFQHIVRFQMSAHVHRLYYQVNRSITNPMQAIGWNSVVGSVTTFFSANPMFTVKHLDEKTLLPIDVQIHTLDIERANAEGEAKWEEVFDYRKDYGLTNLSPASMMELSERILTDRETAAQLGWNGIGRSKKKPWSPYSDIELYCLTSASEMHEWFECMYSEGKKKSGFGTTPKLFSKDVVEYAVDMMVGDWIEVTYPID